MDLRELFYLEIFYVNDCFYMKWMWIAIAKRSNWEKLCVHVEIEMFSPNFIEKK